MTEPQTPLEELLHVDDRPGPAKRLSDADAAALIDRVMEASTPARAKRVAPSPWMWLGMAAIVISSVAVAATYVWPVAPEPSRDAPPEATPETPEPSSTVEGRWGRADEDTSEPELEAEPEVEEAPTPQIDEPGPEPAEDRSARPTPHPSLPASLPDRLAEANRLRGAAQWADAASAYRAVARDARGQDEGYIASVAAASLSLEHLDDPRRALSLFGAALRERPRGSLATDCRLGIARAHRALGDVENERLMLREVLAHDGDSPLAAQAARRLEALGAEPSE